MVRNRPATASPRRKNRDNNGPVPKNAGSARRQALLVVAAELFAVQGYQATTVRDVAEASGLLSGSLYHHFDSKESIIDELLSSYLEELISTCEEIVSADIGPKEKFERLTASAFLSVRDHRAAITVLQNERQQLLALERFSCLVEREGRVRKMWLSVIEDGIRGGVFRSDLDPDVVYRFIRDAIWVSVRWYRPDGRLSPGQLTEQYVSMIFDGVANRAPAGEESINRSPSAITQEGTLAC
jgi:AcrR family transcriptional regulator